MPGADSLTVRPLAAARCRQMHPGAQRKQAERQQQQHPNHQKAWSLVIEQTEQRLLVVLGQERTAISADQSGRPIARLTQQTTMAERAGQSRQRRSSAKAASCSAAMPQTRGGRSEDKPWGERWSR